MQIYRVVNFALSVFGHVRYRSSILATNLGSLFETNHLPLNLLNGNTEVCVILFSFGECFFTKHNRPFFSNRSFIVNTPGGDEQAA